MPVTLTNDLQTWRRLKLGGGGWVTSFVQHSDGTLVARTDTNGAMLWNAGTSLWEEMFTTARLPSAFNRQDFHNGCFEIDIAPSNSSVMYALYMDHMIKSTDKGATWALCAGWTRVAGENGGNTGAQRTYSNKIAIDPLDANVVYVGTMERGLFYTRDGGTTFTLSSTVPHPKSYSGAAATITAITKAASAVVTYSGADIFSVNDYVGFANVAGMTEINNRYGTVTAVDTGANTITVNINSSAFATYTSGGTVGKSGSAELPGVTGIVFDPTSGSTGGRTSKLVCCSYGHGFYETTDGGTNFTLINGPTDCANAAFDSTGTLFACTATVASRRKAGVWDDITGTMDSTWSIAVDPNTANRVVFGNSSGFLYECLNANAATPTYSAFINPYTRVATDIPWLAYTNEQYMSSGTIRFDKTTANKLLFAEGIGFWTAPFTSGSTTITWTSQTAGIDQLCVTHLVQPWNSKLVHVSVLDRDCFRLANLDRYPTSHRAKDPNPTRAITHGYSFNALYSNPNIVVGIGMTVSNANDRIQHSTDGGLTYTETATQPAWVNGYCHSYPEIWPLSETKWVIVGGNSNGVFYTTNSGATWALATFSDSAPWSSFNETNTMVRNSIAQDYENPGHAYILGKPSAVFGEYKIYKTTDYGANWTLTATINPVNTNNYHMKLRSVPGYTGHLWASPGHGGSEADTGTPYGALIYSADGAATWTEVGKISGTSYIKEVYNFAFSAAAPGRINPTLWILGWVNGDTNSDFGYYYCKDWSDSTNPALWTWFKAGDGYPLGNSSHIVAMDGDKNVWNRLYAGTASAGAFYCGPAHSAGTMTMQIMTA